MKCTGGARPGTVLAFLLLLPFSRQVPGADIVQDRSLPIDGRILFQYPSGVVIAGGQAIVSDRHACKLTVISLKDGKRVRDFGRLGVGPNEFTAPVVRDAACGEVAITNIGQNMTYFYFFDERTARFTFSHRYGEAGSVMDVKILAPGEYLLSTLNHPSPRDGRLYVLLKITRTGKKEFLLDIDESFAGKTNFNAGNRSRIPALYSLPLYSMCDFNDRWYLYNWAGSPDPITIDRAGGRRAMLRLRSPERYRRPQDPGSFEKAAKKMDKRRYGREMEKYSWVMYSFLTARSVGLVYAERSPAKRAWRFRAALFSHAGDLLCDRELAGSEREGMLGWPGLFFFDRQKGILYSLSQRLAEGHEESYSLASYRVVE